MRLYFFAFISTSNCQEDSGPPSLESPSLCPRWLLLVLNPAGRFSRSFTFSAASFVWSSLVVSGGNKQALNQVARLMFILILTPAKLEAPFQALGLLREWAVNVEALDWLLALRGCEFLSQARGWRHF